MRDMFCPECGFKNEDGAIFCANCGYRLQEVLQQENIGMEGYAEEETFEADHEPVPEKTRQAAPKSKRASSKGKLLIVGIVTGVVALAGVLSLVLYHVKFGAKVTAEEYAESVLEQDWDDVYDMLLMEEKGQFLTKQAFVSAKTMTEAEEPEDVEIRDVSKKSGGFTSCVYRVRYQADGVSGSMDAELFRDGLVWKAEADSYIVNDYTVSVPEGADAAVDKIKISDSIQPSSQIEGYDTYVIPAVFGNTHYVEVSGENLEEQGTLFVWDSEAGMQLSDSIVVAADPGKTGGASDEQYADGNGKTDEKTEEGIHRYEYIVEDCSWNDAFGMSLERGGYLVRFNSLEEYNYVLGEIYNKGLDKIHFYLGARRDGNDYFWVDENNEPYGEALNSSQAWCFGEWLSGEPSYSDPDLGIDEPYLNMFYLKREGNFVWGDGPEDIPSAVPDFKGKVGYIVEYEE